MLSLGVDSSLFCRGNIGGILSPRLPSPKKLIISRGSPYQNLGAVLPTQNASSAISRCISTEGQGVYGSPTMIWPENGEDPFVQAGLRQESMPKHVAAILDGNRRWAEAHGKDLDYSLFCQGYMSLAHLCIKWGVSTLSCFMFSTENWKRSKEANDLLFGQFQKYLEQSLEVFMSKGIKVTIIGEKTRLPKDLQEVIKKVEEETKINSTLELNFAVSYGGKWDIVQAIRSISRKAKAGEIGLQDVDGTLMDQQLSTNGLGVPDPDMMIRTGGDQRVSNFLMWQMPHTEFYFTDVYGPDFREPHFIDALRRFQQSDRRFGE
ncbi:hypothetical protein Cgig2_024718 [Carnegiea gigantea]|uniref:Alkyl transferase n=1 Tax=Carnegiea gigantea TaxID=171969 RepID=A0A9Q1JSE6_9CARY|nr:hypothetical protein Cgig2_024718 [Carnegiea gigantea]